MSLFIFRRSARGAQPREWGSRATHNPEARSHNIRRDHSRLPFRAFELSRFLKGTNEGSCSLGGRKIKVIRITRHPADESRVAALRAAFGSDTVVVDDDVPYGDDPVKAVVDLIAKHGDVVAIEVVAPVPVLAKLTAAKRELAGVLILRAEFAHGPDGRALVVSKDANGRDVFGFGHYDVVEKVEVKTRPLIGG